jgi:hypothetical protein
MSHLSYFEAVFAAWVAYGQTLLEVSALVLLAVLVIAEFNEW